MSKELLFSVSVKDCEEQHFRSGGKGGQGQNKVNSGVRLIHHPSGARGEARDSRDQIRNKRNAFMRLIVTEQFKAWHRTETARRLGKLKDVEATVTAAMEPQNLKVEVQSRKGWVNESENITEE